MALQTTAEEGPAGGGARLSDGRYEFTAEENVGIERAGRSASIWAVCAIVGAVLLGVLAALQLHLDNPRGAILVLPLLLVCAVAGWLYLGVGRALKGVARTEGDDVELLMRALDRLAKAFRSEVAVTLIAVLVLLGLAVATRL